MPAALFLAWTLLGMCDVVNHYRAQGYSDSQIEQGARQRDVPEWLIKLAKSRCKRAP